MSPSLIGTEARIACVLVRRPCCALGDWSLDGGARAVGTDPNVSMPFPGAGGACGKPECNSSAPPITMLPAKSCGRK